MSDDATAIELRLTPHGVLVPAGGAAGEGAAGKGLGARFAEHEAAGLVALGAGGVPEGCGPAMMFWREVAAELLRALCHVPEGVALTPEAVEFPGAGWAAERVLNAPPMPGGEYLSPEVLGGVWERAVRWVMAQAEACGGLAGFLEAYAPQWSRVGRVTLHLAENKKDAEYPFAFMASYAAGMTAAGRVRRLPLGRALEEFAGARRKPELVRLLAPLHAATQRSELIAELVASGDVFHPLVWTPGEAHAFLREIPVYEECGLLAQLPNWWRKRARPQVRVTLDRGSGSAVGMDAMLAFDLSLALGGETLTAKEVAALMRSTDGLVLLRGEWVEVDSERLREALAHWKEVERQARDGGISFVEGMRLLAGASADLAGGGEGEEVAAWHLVEAGPELREILDGMRTPAGLSGPQPAKLQGELRHYQLEGLNWLWLCAQLGVGACLADDMGLGKTIQILAALLRHREQRGARGAPPSLLVVPASLIGNWKAEAARFAPSLQLLVVHSSECSRAELAALAADPGEGLRGRQLVITTYSMVARLPWLAEVAWSWVILDEAQAIKNPGTRQTKEVKKLAGAMRIALTGTPVENRLGDLWSLFDFINPGLLGSAARFRSFTKALEERQEARYAPLRKLVAPYILRRMKTDPEIVPDLPDKTEMQVYCGLSKPQAVLYRQTVEALRKSLEGDRLDGIQRRGLVLSSLMRFKQICNHPSQLVGDGSWEPGASGKFGRLGALCAEIASRGEKALVFTQFREISAPLAEFLAGIFGGGGLVLHGGTAVGKRRKLVDAFQREDGPPFFVLSLKAGGTGLNLTAASHVIHFDRWWNPAVENQATDRAFRIGQQRNVLVHKFVTRGTIEEKIDALIRGKQEMAEAILEGGAEKGLTEMSDEEILAMVSLDLERAMV